ERDRQLNRTENLASETHVDGRSRLWFVTRIVSEDAVVVIDVERDLEICAQTGSFFKVRPAGRGICRDIVAKRESKTVGRRNRAAANQGLEPGGKPVNRQTRIGVRNHKSAVLVINRNRQFQRS